MSDSSDDDLFLSASEGEDNEDECTTAKAVPNEDEAAAKTKGDAPKVVEEEAIIAETEDTDERAPKDAVGTNVQQAAKGESPEQEESPAAVTRKDEGRKPPVLRECSTEDSQRKASGSTEVICKQQISEIKIENQQLPEAVPDEETTSSKELVWDDFNVDVDEQNEDECNADGWDTWDGPENETESSSGDAQTEKKNIEDESDWFSEQATKTKEEKKNESRSKGSMWEWAGINEVVSAVGEGFSNVVENSLGLPSAEEMARITKQQEQVKPSNPDEEEEPEASTSSGPSFGGLFSGFVIGGLDVLESLGKKTFETLTPEGPANLSRILKERMNDESDPIFEQSLAGYGSTSCEKFKGVCFQKEFDSDEGSVHLEGLQLISSNFARQNSSSPKSSFELLLKNYHVVDSEVCSANSFEPELKAILSEVNLPYKAPNMLAAHRTLISLMETEPKEADDVYKSAIVVLAKFTAQSIQVFHKLSQLMLIAGSLPPPESLIALGSLFTQRMNSISQHFAQSISSCDFSDTTDEMVTTIYFEASNAHHHIRAALECFKPFY
ncbi:hypothetical protein QR680_017210 [Steinernema hermaphroditum]|uniref:Protein FAM114A2 n=1 Tax=Steinernema hermaphroditum TaxID=289476 RepID=A0AA39HER6_9BILA|nr:hypothetical protein QR680_017210 [Steinernema hermaphroditum]